MAAGLTRLRALELLRRPAVAPAVLGGLTMSLIVAGLGLVTASSAVAGGILAVVLLVAGLTARFMHALPRTFLGFLGVCLIGYAFLGRGFSYLGYPPLYIGEVALLFGGLALAIGGDLRAFLRTALGWAVLAFMAIGLLATVPHVGPHGIDALRDAAVWGYAAFALIVAGLVRHRSLVWVVLQRYAAVIPWFLVLISASFLVLALARDLVPNTPFSTVRILGWKAGDVAVHLSGIMTFMALGLHRLTGATSRTGVWSREWALWLIWLLALATTFTSRASIITVAAVAALVLLTRSGARWGRLVSIALALLVASYTFDLELTLGRGEDRPISAQGLVTMVESIFNPVGSGGLDGTRTWRLEWWNDIVDYTVFGPYFWTGKGFGINLADADGYQVYSDSSLRSPHNGHLTLLARSGVPGAVAWIFLNAALVLTLWRARQRRRREGREFWARVNLWLIAYWLAFVVNASFDVYLEGPAGGIWYWSLIGFALAVLWVQHRPRLSARPSP